MNKKIFFIFVVLVVIGLIFFSKGRSMNIKPCVFCNHDILTRQTFYEDDLVLALYTHKPIFPGHCLIVPKRCVNRFEELSNEEMVRIKETIEKVDLAAKKVFNVCSYLILQKNGVEVGQTEPHVHFHYIPREKGDSSTILFMVRMLFFSMMGPISSQEMKETVGKMHQAMEEIEEQNNKRAM